MSVLGNECRLTFVQLADPQLGMGGYAHDMEAFRIAVRDINALEPDMVWICGDLAHDTEDPEAFADFQAIRAGLRAPSFCVPGNHDVGNAPSAALLARYRTLIGPDQFVIEHKGCTFIGLNTQLWKSPLEEETDAQDRWLRHELQLARQQRRPVFILGHYPLFTDRPDEDEFYFNLPRARREDLLGLFRRYNVKAMLTGHVHRNLVLQPEGIDIVATASTSYNYDHAPLGYRVWRVTIDPASRVLLTIDHAYRALSEAPVTPQQNPDEFAAA